MGQRSARMATTRARVIAQSCDARHAARSVAGMDLPGSTERREFITLLGGAAAWSLRRPQHRCRDRMPHPTRFADRLAVRQAAQERHVERRERIDRIPLGGQTDRVCPRWRPNWFATDRRDRRRPLSIRGQGHDIPIVFMVGEDPVRLGLAPAIARPGGNLRAQFLTVSRVAKRCWNSARACPMRRWPRSSIRHGLEPSHVARRGAAARADRVANPGSLDD